MNHGGSSGNVGVNWFNGIKLGIVNTSRSLTTLMLLRKSNKWAKSCSADSDIFCNDKRSAGVSSATSSNNTATKPTTVTDHSVLPRNVVKLNYFSTFERINFIQIFIKKNKFSS